jgi:hypothetical protein
MGRGLSSQPLGQAIEGHILRIDDVDHFGPAQMREGPVNCSRRALGSISLCPTRP